MNKMFALLLLLIAPLAHAGEAEIRQSFAAKFPDIDKLDHIVKTPYSGLYEIVVNGQIMYTDEQGVYLFDGNVIDLATRTNLTEKQSQKLFAIDFDKLPLNLAIKKVKGNGKRKMAYFTDPNCGYCKKLEKELSKVTDVTLYIFLYPIFQGSDVMVNNILCAKSPVKAWDELMQNGNAAPAATCKTNTDKVLALGKKLRVTGTPNLIFANGVQSPGYLPSEELEKHLNEVKAK
ncbi:MAG: DsbC family protein [Sideroxydans sp.]|nr:DsbC family protein [Sideroxydans sp.]